MSITTINESKVVIIGAGLAALGAAIKLNEHQIEDIKIFEAQNYVGGRVKTIVLNQKDTPPITLDLGAQWLHGTDNELYRLAAAHRLLADEKSEEGLGIYIRSNGDVIDKLFVDEMAKLMENLLNNTSRHNNEGIQTIQEYLDQNFDTILSKNSNLKEIYQDLYDWHLRFQIIDNSCQTMSDLCVTHWSDYECFDDLLIHSNLKYGFQSIIEKILENNPSILKKIQLETEVTNVAIDHMSKKIQLHLQRHLPDGGVENCIFYCDHLILTASLGVLKNTSILNDIYQDKFIKNNDLIYKTIDQMGFAGICKIFLIYDTKWWGNSNGFQLLWNAYELKTLTNNKNWLRYLTGFDVIFQSENVLMTWVGGEGVALVEKKSDEEISTECTELLRQFLTGKFKVTTPTRVIRTKWLSNKFVQGSYCHIKPNCQNGIAPLKQPFLLDNVPKIVLAGEGIHTTHYSTAHGAFESGMEQADLICQFLIKNNN